MFKGLSKFKYEYDIKLKPNAIPIAHVPRRIPLAIQSKLEMKLKELIKNNVIKKADDFSEWVNFIVTAEKKDSEKTLRICLDPRELNEWILNEQAYIPSFDDVASKLSGMKYFSVLDLKDGFWHVVLTKRSRNLCTFATPFGNYRFIRMPFGIKTAPSVFQRLNFDIFGDIGNVVIY